MWLFCVSPGEEYSPSYYPLQNDDTQVCLATGFSRYEENEKYVEFNETQPARIEGDSLFNQVAFNSSCTTPTENDGLCQDELRPGECWRQCDTADMSVSPFVCVVVCLTVALLVHRSHVEPGVSDRPRPAAHPPQNHRLQRLPDLSAVAQSM